MKLTIDKVNAINLLKNEGWINTRIAKIFNLSDATISKLVRANFIHEEYTKIGKQYSLRVKKRPFITMISRRIAGVKSVVYAKRGV